MNFRLRFIYGVIPFIFQITEDLPEDVGAMTVRFWHAKIRRKYIENHDEGIQQHEMQHGKDILYNMLPGHKYTHLEKEVRAYKVQLKYYADDRSELFAWYISKFYKTINISPEAALLLLRA